MRSKLGLVFIFALLIVSAALAQTAQITFPTEGEREVWSAYGLPSEPPTTGFKTKELLLSFDLTGKKDSDSVFVWEKASGNLASKQVKDVKSSWQVAAADFLDIGLVKVRVEAGGKPVDAAQVQLKDSRRELSQLVAPSSKGEVSFFAVKPGKIEITVTYKSGGKDKKLNQVFELKLERPEPTPILALGIAGVVDAAPSASAPDAPEQKTQSPNGKEPAQATSGASTAQGASLLGTLIVYLLGLGVIGGAVYYALQVWKRNSDRIAPELEKLGVQIPKAADPVADPAPMPMPVAPEPIQKIVLDNATPDPIPVASPSTSVARAKLPRLVSESGAVINLEPGENWVGRELGHWLSLPAESTVSRSHAMFNYSGGTVTVEDHGSTNGSFVNGAKLDMPIALAHGDAIQFGAVRYRYEE